NRRLMWHGMFLFLLGLLTGKSSQNRLASSHPFRGHRAEDSSALSVAVGGIENPSPRDHLRAASLERNMQDRFHVKEVLNERHISRHSLWGPPVAPGAWVSRRGRSFSGARYRRAAARKCKEISERPCKV